MRVKALVLFLFFILFSCGTTEFAVREIQPLKKNGEAIEIELLNKITSLPYLRHLPRYEYDGELNRSPFVQIFKVIIENQTQGDLIYLKEVALKYGTNVVSPYGIHQFLEMYPRGLYNSEDYLPMFVQKTGTNFHVIEDYVKLGENGIKDDFLLVFEQFPANFDTLNLSFKLSSKEDKVKKKITLGFSHEIKRRTVSKKQLREWTRPTKVTSKQ